MRAEMIAYMIYLEGPEYHEYVMHICYLKYSGTPKDGNMLGNSLQDWASWSYPRNNRKLPKIFGLSTIKEYVMHNFLHEVFPGIFQVKWPFLTHPDLGSVQGNRDRNSRGISIELPS